MPLKFHKITNDVTNEGNSYEANFTASAVIRRLLKFMGNNFFAVENKTKNFQYALHVHRKKIYIP